jgi:ATP-binding cassette subfamily B (MDR/TAP) protein 1
MANLQDLADTMPDGFNTVVGAGGNLLSGGQRQRVAIARARLRDTPILILDECTSALDSKNRTAVMKSIREWRRGKTTIIITHDTTQVLEGDFVYVLEDGEVIHSSRKAGLGGMTEAGCCFPSNSAESVLETEIFEKEPEHPLCVAISKYNLQSNPPQAPLSLQLSESERTLGRSAFDHFVSEDQILVSSNLPYPQRAVTSRSHLLTLNDTSFSEDSPGQLQAGSDLINKPLPSIELPSRNNNCYLSGFGSTKLGAKFRFLDLRLATLTPRKHNRPAKTNSPISTPQIMSTVFPHLTLTQHFYLILGFLCSLIHSSATPVFAFLFSRLLETFYIPGNRSQMARRWSLAVLGVAIGDAAAAYWMHYLLEYCGQAWTDSLRGAAMVRILDQPRSWFELDENMSQLLVLYLDQNAEEMRKLIGKFAAYVLVATSIILIAFSWSFTISWKLTIVGLACGPLIFAITRGFEVVSGKWEQRSNGIYEKTVSIFSETFLGIRTVKALTLESYFDEKHFRALRKGMKLCLKRASFTGFFFGLTESAVIFVTGKLPRSFRMPAVLSDTPVIALLFFYGAVLESSLELTANDAIIVFSMLLLSMGYVNVVLTWSKSILTPPQAPLR